MMKNKCKPMKDTDTVVEHGTLIWKKNEYLKTWEAYFDIVGKK